MNKTIIVIILFVLSSCFAIGEEIPNKLSFSKSNMRIGGDVGLAFQNEGKFATLAPVIGYFYPKLYTSLGGLYRVKWRRYLDTRTKTNIRGLHATVRYDVFKFAFVQSKYQFNTSCTTSVQSGGIGFNRQCYLGAGYSQNIGKESHFYVALMIDFLSSIDYVESPSLQTGINIGL